MNPEQVFSRAHPFVDSSSERVLRKRKQPEVPRNFFKKAYTPKIANNFVVTDDPQKQVSNKDQNGAMNISEAVQNLGDKIQSGSFGLPSLKKGRKQTKAIISFRIKKLLVLKQKNKLRAFQDACSLPWSLTCDLQRSNRSEIRSKHAMTRRRASNGKFSNEKSPISCYKAPFFADRTTRIPSESSISLVERLDHKYRTLITSNQTSSGSGFLTPYSDSNLDTFSHSDFFLSQKDAVLGEPNFENHKEKSHTVNLQAASQTPTPNEIPKLVPSQQISTLDPLVELTQDTTITDRLSILESEDPLFA